MTSFIVISIAIIALVSLYLLYKVKKHGGAFLPVLISLLVVYPLVAWVYVSIGSPQHITGEIGNNEQASREEVLENIARLEQELKDNPSDKQKLIQLAFSYLYTEQYEKSIFLFEILAKSEAHNPDVLVQTADVIARASGGNVTVKAQKYLDQALAVSPSHQQALWMSGLGASQRQDNEKAIAYWTRLLATLESTKEREEVSNMIAQLASQPTSAAHGLNNGISATVSLDPALSLKPDQVVFVLAKSLEGPPAPLAVKRLLVSELPTTIVLSDADAMMPGHQISSYKNIEVFAKVTEDNSATGPLVASSEKAEVQPEANQKLELIVKKPNS